MTRKSPQAAKSKIDGSTIVKILLGYEDYWRLMLLLLVSGLLAGLAMYVNSRPTYYSSALIRVNKYVDSSQVAQGARGEEYHYHMLRTLMLQLGSDRITLDTARKMGVIGSRTSSSDLRASLIPSVTVGLLDSAHLEVSVVAFSPRIVREFPLAIAEVYEENRVKLRAEHRDKAIKRYMEELGVVREKVSNQLDARLKFEEESALASAQIEMERLSNVPVDLIRQRYRLQEMERIRSVLEEQKADLGEVGQLTLLTSLPKISNEDPLNDGVIVRQPDRSAPFSFISPGTKKDFTQVVVQPDMVEGIEPWRDLEKQKRSIEEKVRLTRVKFLEDHPEMIKLREELRTVTSALSLELDVAKKAFELEYEGTKNRIADLEKKVPAYHEATKSFDEKKTGYELVKKGELAWDQAYEELSRQIKSLQFGNDGGSVNLEFRGFIDIRSEVPISPSKSKLAMMGCLLGLGLAGGVPFLLRRFNSSVTDLTEFETQLGILGIGLVPLTDSAILERINRSKTIGSEIPNALLENFRLIRSSIILNRSPRGEAKVIMVTSARPGEGKTTIAANIAWAFSSMGDRTLVIDCDLRRGRLHQVADLPNEPGLTAVLAGKANLEDCIQKSQADNLWVIPRGPVVPGTTEILNTPIFAKILEQLKGDYDRIILDTPPVLGLSETAFLQSHAEGVVLVVKAAATPRKDVEDAFAALEKLDAHFYGFVLNRVDFSKRANHFNYYYYSASYYDTNWEQEEADAKALPSVS